MNFKVNSRENVYFCLMATISLIAYSIFIFFASEVLIGFYLYFAFFVVYFQLHHVFFIGYIKGNSVKVTDKQFPEVFEIIKHHSEKLELEEIPDLYILQGNGVMNAFATRFAGKGRVVIHSNVFEVAYQEGMPAVEFIIGHELGHVKRRHVNFWKTLLILPAKIIFPLGLAYSRACEYTCDNIGYALCPEGAEKGLLILAVGKQLYTKINVHELLSNEDNRESISMKFAELFSTHPHLVNRIGQLRQSLYFKD